MTNVRPLNNNALVEIIKEHAGVARAGSGESPNRGRLVEVTVSGYHLTASAGFEMDAHALKEYWDKHTGKIVRWEEYADSGQKFTEDGKEYALIPWWRITAFEEDNESQTSKEES
jgi:hypothetical protein